MSEELHISFDNAEVWPALPLEGWRETCETLQLWTQVVGKIRLALSPPINHWWGVPLYVTARGLTTSPIPYGKCAFQMDFDFIRHELVIDVSTGEQCILPLKAQSVASFYRDVLAALHSLDIRVKIWPVPVEVPDPIAFEQDTMHKAYDPEQAQRFWRILVQTDRIFTNFRSRFLGKVSPVHFFWGSFDLAVTRFSGRVAPKHPGAPGLAERVVQEAYSHEVSSAGFWPGGGGVDFPAFYSYAYPEPPGYDHFSVLSAEAYYNTQIHEFLLPYEAIRLAPSPDEMLLAFLQSTYEAAADLGQWDRAALERTASPTPFKVQSSILEVYQ